MDGPVATLAAFLIVAFLLGVNQTLKKSSKVIAKEREKGFGRVDNAQADRELREQRANQRKQGWTAWSHLTKQLRSLDGLVILTMDDNAEGCFSILIEESSPDGLSRPIVQLSYDFLRQHGKNSRGKLTYGTNEQEMFFNIFGSASLYCLDRFVVKEVHDHVSSKKLALI